MLASIVLGKEYRDYIFSTLILRQRMKFIALEHDILSLFLKSVIYAVGNIGSHTSNTLVFWRSIPFSRAVLEYNAIETLAVLWPFMGNRSVTDRFPTLSASNAELCYIFLLESRNKLSEKQSSLLVIWICDYSYPAPHHLKHGEHRDMLIPSVT